ncbi:MAG: PH domain-containing protein [Pseudomonadota bacterium]|nr:PH domain-containing protein [Pseudomonadota bacterium]
MSEILYEANPSMVRMNPFGTSLAVLLVPLAAVGSVLLGPPLAYGLIPLAGGAIILLLYWYVSAKMDHLVIKPDEIVWTHGLVSKQYTEISMGSVRTVKVSQTLFQRIMGAGDVAIFTSGDEPELVVRGLPDPNAIREYVKGQAVAET